MQIDKPLNRQRLTNLSVIKGGRKEKSPLMRGTVQGKHLLAESKLTMIKHKHLRDPSPEEKLLPSKFSVNRNIAYLFEEDQPRFGSYLNTAGK